MESKSVEGERAFILTDGSVKLTLEWQSAAELPGCNEVGMVAVQKRSGGYDYAKALLACPSCRERFVVMPKRHDEGRSPVMKMCKVDLRAAVVVEEDCADVADALIDNDALGVLDMAGNVAIDEGDGLYAICPACGASFLVSMGESGTCCITIRNKESEVVIEDSFGRRMRYLRNGGFDSFEDPENDGPANQLRGMSALKTAVLGVSAEACRYLRLSLGLGCGMPRIADGVDLLDIAVGNRWRYDWSFCQDAKEVVALVDPREGNHLYPGSELFELPRDFEEEMMSEILAKNLWPDVPEVRKAVRNRLAIAAMLGHERLGRICGCDPKAVTKLLGSHAVGIDFVYALYDEHRVFSHGLNDLLLAAAREEEPVELVDALVEMGPDAIGRCLDGFCKLKLGRLEAYAAYRAARREHSLDEVLAFPGLLGRYEARADGFKIRYTDYELSLADEIGGCRFSLPKTVGAITAINRELGDGILGNCGVEAAFGEKVMVSVASRGRFEAMMRLDIGRRAVEWVSYRSEHARRNRKVDKAIGAWAEGKGFQGV